MISGIFTSICKRKIPLYNELLQSTVIPQHDELSAFLYVEFDSPIHSSVVLLQNLFILKTICFIHPNLL